MKTEQYVDDIHEVMKVNVLTLEDLLMRRSEYVVNDDVQRIYKVTEVLYNLSVECLGYENKTKEENQKKEG